MNVEELKQLFHGQNEEVLSSNMPDIINSVMTLYEKGIAVGMKIGGQIKVKQSCEWLDNNFPTIDNVGSWYKENFIKEFKRHLEEQL